MKDLADFIRFLTPNLTAFLFFYCKSIFIKLLVLCFIAFSIYTEIIYKECPISILEREFHNETWDDILDMIFKWFGWKVPRNEKVVGFICFNIGIFLAFSFFTIYSIFY
jgi:hypothetical protein